MSKKVKKIFKSRLKLAPKVSINKKWTIWRKTETKNLKILTKYELKNLVLHTLYTDNLSNLNYKLDKSYKNKLHYKMSYINKRSKQSKQKNYCYYIGRSRSFSRDLFMSRHIFRKFARFGMLPGFVKERC